jgi:hypothetical protein
MSDGVLFEIVIHRIDVFYQGTKVFVFLRKYVDG